MPKKKTKAEFVRRQRRKGRSRKQNERDVGAPPYELFYSTGGHTGPFASLDAALRHGARAIRGNPGERWVYIVSRQQRWEAVPQAQIRTLPGYLLTRGEVEAGRHGGGRRNPRPNHHHPWSGTVIHATLREEDLIPAFVDELGRVMQESTFEPGADAPGRVKRIGELEDKLGDLERRMGQPGYYESEEADWDLEWLFDTLNEFAPENYYFGAHPGDASDFGWWEVEPEYLDNPLPQAVKREYEWLREVGLPARDAMRGARVNVAFAEAEAEGLASFDVRPDPEPDVSFVDTWDVSRQKAERIKQNILDRVQREGLWGIEVSVRGEPIDAVWGFVGEDWLDSGYDIDLKAAALDELGVDYEANPLRRGWSREVISDNIRYMIDKGAAQDQAVAASLSSARKSYRSRHPRGAFPRHLQRTN